MQTRLSLNFFTKHFTEESSFDEANAQANGSHIDPLDLIEQQQQHFPW